MSAIRAALRLATVAAIRDRTWIGRVADSANTPIEETIVQEATPYASVWIDDDDLEGEGMEEGGAGRSVLMIIEFGVSAPLMPQEGGEVKPIKIGMPSESDESFEMILDAVEAQIRRALWSPMSPWGRHWNRFVNSCGPINSKRGSSADKSIRWAARQRIMRLNIIADPPDGYVFADDHPLKAFIAAARVAEDGLGLKDKADFLEQMFTTDALPDWRVAQGWLGLSGRGIRHLGIAPIFDAEGEPPPIAPEEGSINPVEVTKEEVAAGDDDFYGNAD